MISTTINTTTSIIEIIGPNKNTPFACEMIKPIIGNTNIIDTDWADLLVFTLCDTATTSEIDKNVINGAIKKVTIIQLKFGKIISPNTLTP